MPGQERIIQYAQKLVPLTLEEADLFSSVFKEKRFKKRQFLIQPGFVDKYKYFVLKGAIKAYVIDQQGQEITVQLAIEDWWISDYNSYIHQQPASLFVEAVEDSEVLEISYEDEQYLKTVNPRFETFFRIMAERGAAFLQRRFILSITQTAAERYDQFIAAYPQLLAKFPQYVIASYLGMTTQFFSRIRNNKAGK
ncbi:Crp/Fnr family transcriptional regulator [Chitinophaga sp. sic0106]|uniref:Crp/Fnr family transcriptional regulator n=1 Tax=Chitinophaga sp. sic0106 TaxID=2854785 RepID=UPI001C471B83|nr:Crp/Fnr family transcriptional regulator [Chitinophaga sp. sic0106]MBV7533034.1 Crp/Fnr family transcriptional regulator [Chitinophaga sp. sic0106]